MPHTIRAADLTQVRWEKLDESVEASFISKHVDLVETQWANDVTGFEYCSDAFYQEVELTPSEEFVVDFYNIEYSVLGHTLTKSWNKLKLLVVENSSLNYLDISTRGLTNTIGLTSDDTNVGALGLFVHKTTIGVTIDSTHRNFRLQNNSSGTINAKILAIGVQNV